MPTPDPLSSYLQPGPTARLAGVVLRFRTAPGLFSPDRIDDGTRLLLDHLPAGEPSEVLDLGCGYGALGLPIAASRPGTRVTCVDRDALAAAACGLNARDNGLANVDARPGLGHRDSPDRRWDWVLCNVPARIGAQGIAALVEGGFPKLAPGGEVRVVVIHDLVPVLRQLAEARGWVASEVATGARHAIWSARPGPGWTEAGVDGERSYWLDEVVLEAPDGPVALDRYQDASEDPSHLREGLPLLLACLPSNPVSPAVCWRSGAGAAPIVLGRRKSGVVAVDRDLLALDFVRRNGRRASLAIETVIAPTLEATWDGPLGAPRLIVGESTPAFGPELGHRELDQARRHLAKGGEALWLVGERQGKGWLSADPSLVRLAARGRWMVLRGGARR